MKQPSGQHIRSTTVENYTKSSWNPTYLHFFPSLFRKLSDLHFPKSTAQGKGLIECLLHSAGDPFNGSFVLLNGKYALRTQSDEMFKRKRSCPPSCIKSQYRMKDQKPRHSTALHIGFGVARLATLSTTSPAVVICNILRHKYRTIVFPINRGRWEFELVPHVANHLACHETSCRRNKQLSNSRRNRAAYVLVMRVQS